MLMVEGDGGVQHVVKCGGNLFYVLFECLLFYLPVYFISIFCSFHPVENE